MLNPVSPIVLLEALNSRFKTHLMTATTESSYVSVQIPWALDPSMIGHFNLHHPYVVQVVGRNQVEAMAELEKSIENIAKSINQNTLAILFCEGVKAPSFLLNHLAQKKRNAGVIEVEAKAVTVIDHLYKSFTKKISPRETMHGVFLEIYGIGVIITGKPSIGKSEIALEMISRGHKFIADDLVELVRESESRVVGTCSHIIQDMIEVRSLGILNIKRLYGNHVVLPRQVLSFILVMFEGTSRMADYDRIKPLQLQPQKVLGIDIPVFPLQVRSGRNLAILIEASVRSFLLRTQQNYDTANEIISRQEEMIQGNLEAASQQTQPPEK